MIFTKEEDLKLARHSFLRALTFRFLMRTTCMDCDPGGVITGKGYQCGSSEYPHDQTDSIPEHVNSYAKQNVQSPQEET